MNYYQHRFSSVENYLHHRDPYLLVDSIVSISREQIVTQKMVTGNEFFISGHFPGSPIFPGAMMQEMTTQSAGILIAAEFNPMQQYKTEDPAHNEYALGVLIKIGQARYKSFARPGDLLEVTIELTDHFAGVFDFSGSIKVGSKIIMRNSFQLTNVKSTLLQGN